MRDTIDPGASPRSRARRAVATPVLAVLTLGLLAGCTGQPGTGSGPSPTVAAGAASSPAGRALAELPVERAGSGEDYDREEQFGGWADPDGNGCDARNDVLARDLVDEEVDDDGCTVLSGTLDDPYTGRTIDFVRGPATSADVQIDHVVALKNAWISGADRLSRDERVALANDPLNLRATDGPTNGDKSDADASRWLPPDESFRCEYVATQVAVKTRYDLFVTADEKDAMAEVLSGCPGQELPETVPPAGAAGAAEPASAPTPAAAAPAAGPASPAASSAASAAEVYYADCAAVRAAGAAPLRSDQPGYRAALDRGGAEGLACEG
ncbi:MAG TPA: HNH endonuclease family protein [Kocuria rosea]|nr:HNH endonuclease family protein [Kocuria rosea]